MLVNVILFQYSDFRKVEIDLPEYAVGYVERIQRAFGTETLATYKQTLQATIAASEALFVANIEMAEAGTRTPEIMAVLTEVAWNLREYLSGRGAHLDDIEGRARNEAVGGMLTYAIEYIRDAAEVTQTMLDVLGKPHLAHIG